MSSFYEDASLVMIPSGYKTSKVYCAKPTDGTGDLTFTRSNDTATRVASNGLIEKVRTNRFTYSQNIANAAWETLTNGGTITKTANAGTAPDGTNTASRLQVAGGGTYSLVYQDNVNPLGSVVVSGYFKRYGGTNQTFRLFGDNGNALSSTLTATDTWQRFSFVMTAASAGADGIGADASNNAYDILVWGMQLETGDIATDYIATTTAAVSVGPVANVPRLDYLNSTCPKLLLEPQRTNLYTFSEQLNQWTASSATVTANYAVSPDGYTNADRVQFSAGGLLYISGTGSAGENTLSVYAKATNGTSAKFRFFGNGNTTFSSDQTATGEWQRFTFTFTYSTATAGLKVATTGADDIIFYGFQHEIGAYATSYIPTLAASVTRGAEDATKTGISSLIGQTSGTIFVDCVPNMVGNIFNTNQNNTNTIAINSFGNNRIQARIWASSVLTNIAATPEYALGSNLKIALKYSSGDIKLFINGVLRASSTNTLTFNAAISTIFLNESTTSFSVVSAVRFNSLLIFKTVLTDAQCLELTA